MFESRGNRSEAEKQLLLSVLRNNEPNLPCWVALSEYYDLIWKLDTQLRHLEDFVSTGLMEYTVGQFLNLYDNIADMNMYYVENGVIYVSC